MTGGTNPPRAPGQWHSMKSEKKSHGALHAPSESQEGVGHQAGPTGTCSAAPRRAERKAFCKSQHDLVESGAARRCERVFFPSVPQPDTPSSPTGSLGLPSSSGSPIPVSQGDIRNQAAFFGVNPHPAAWQSVSTVCADTDSLTLRPFLAVRVWGDFSEVKQILMKRNYQPLNILIWESQGYQHQRKSLNFIWSDSWIGRTAQSL